MQFVSIFKYELDSFIKFKISQGCKGSYFIALARQLDRFLIQKNEKTFSAIDCEKWRTKLKSESESAHYRRVNFSKHFFTFLRLKKYDVSIPSDVAFIPSGFRAHIYSRDELHRYFIAVDTFSQNLSVRMRLQIPVIFRLLYSTGMRIGEILNIKKKHVDSETNSIFVPVSKNSKERIVFLSSSMGKLLKCYRDKTFDKIDDDDYIFQDSYCKKLNLSTLGYHHRRFLKLANIPYVGNFKGPRIHDFRHTFAVNSFIQLLKSGLKINVALPVLCKYLGHTSIEATEDYIQIVKNLFPEMIEPFEKKIFYIFKDL